MIASGAPAWAVWLALGLWGLAIVVGVCAFVAARRLWGRVKPMVEPYLLAFGLGAVQSAESAAAGTDALDESADSSPVRRT